MLGQAHTLQSTLAASALPTARFSDPRVLNMGPQSPRKLRRDFKGQQMWVEKNQITVFTNL